MSEKQQSAFERLAALNVNDKLEKKNGLSYLSWAWAWDRLMRNDPDAEYEFGEPRSYGETMMVFCTVKAFGKSRTAHLPVMNHKNQPIPNPDAFQVNTAMQRCMVKAIALHGLGLYVYAGEDVPDGEQAHDAHPQARPADINPAAGVAESLTFDQKENLQQIADEMNRILGMGAISEAVAKLNSYDFAVEEKVYLWSLFGSKERTAMRKLIGDSVPRRGAQKEAA